MALENRLNQILNLINEYEIETQEDDSEPTISREKLSEIIFHAFEESRDYQKYSRSRRRLCACKGYQ